MSSNRTKNNVKKLSDEEIQELSRRLYSTHTKSSNAESHPCLVIAEDKISRKVCSISLISAVVNILINSV